MLQDVIKVAGIALTLLILSACSFMNDIARNSVDAKERYPHRVYARNSETGKVYYAGSRRSVARARALALRKCQRHTQDFNACQLIDTE